MQQTSSQGVMCCHLNQAHKHVDKEDKQKNTQKNWTLKKNYYKDVWEMNLN